MKTLLTLILTLAGISAFAQVRQNVYFFKNNGKEVDLRDSADFTRIIRMPDSGSVLYNVLDYYMNGSIKLRGKSSTIAPILFEDQCVEYFPNGKSKSVSFYKRGILINQQLLFYSNGKLAETRKYPDTISKTPYVSRERSYLTMSFNDSTGTPLVTDGNGRYKKLATETDKLAEEGDLKAGLRDGLWKGHEGSINFEEQYSNGKLLKGTSVTAAGDTVHYADNRMKIPGFKDGINNFYKFLAKNVRYPQRAMQNGTQGRVNVSFVVEKDGHLTDIASTSKVDPDLITEAIRVMKLSPQWEPGIKYGRPVRVSYTSPIVFTLGR